MALSDKLLALSEVPKKIRIFWKARKPESQKIPLS
jgi:hypothetical protein